MSNAPSFNDFAGDHAAQAIASGKRFYVLGRSDGYFVYDTGTNCKAKFGYSFGAAASARDELEADTSRVGIYQWKPIEEKETVNESRRSVDASSPTPHQPQAFGTPPPKSKMVISLDFDDTFTADPPLWKVFIAAARAMGHRIIVVTARDDTTESRKEIMVATGLEVVFASHRPKREAARAAGFEVDIWIDDKPEWVASL